MQQQRNIKHFSVQAFIQNIAGDGQFFFQFAAFYLGQMGDALNGMFVDGIMMVHVELHHGHNGLNFGNEFGQYSQFIHSPQCPAWIAVVQQ